MKKCKICGNPGKIDKQGRQYSICESCLRKKLSESHKKRLSNENIRKEYTKKLSESHKKVWTEEKRKEQSKKLKNIYKDKKLIKKLSESHKQVYINNSELKIQISEKLKQQWTEEKRKEQSKKLKKFHEENPNVSKLTAEKNKKLFSTQEWKEKHRIIMRKICNSDEYIQKQKDNAKRIFENPEIRKKISEKVKEHFKTNPRKEGTLKNYRTGRIKYLKKQLENYGDIQPRLGRNEKQILDKIEDKKGIKLIRQFHISDLGYFVDGYDPINNIVYEVYEKHHLSRIERDDRRINEIKQYLNCDVVIIKDF